MNFFYKKRNYIIAAVLLLSFFVFFPHCSAAPEDVNAAEKFVGGTVKNLIDLTVGFMAEMTTAVLGWLTSKIVAMIIGFANYSDFVNNEQVKDGWTVVRDICNMFFILILLFIAFAVILRMESYSIKKSLPKLLLMAVLINFSRTICGILIDFSQIVMLTFIGPITEGQGNFHNVLRINTFLNSVASAKYENMDLTNTVIYYVIAVIFMLIVTVVLLAVLIAFVMRIVMFWIYIVLSPLAFLLAAFPGGQRYAGQYWGEFTKYLLNGPVLAFFLWLSLYTLGNLEVKQIGDAFSDAPVEILTGENLSRFIMAIGMLVGGLTISAQIGGMGSSWGSGMVSNIKNKGIGVAKRVSGYDAVADRTKAYFAMRKSARDDRVRADAQKIAGVIGGVKKTIAKPVNLAAQEVWSRTPFGRNGAEAKRISQEIKTDRNRIESFSNIANIKNQKKFTHEGVEYDFDKKNKNWTSGEGNNKKVFTDEELKKNLIGVNESDIAKKVKTMDDLNTKQERMDKWGKRGLAVAGGVVGGILGGGAGAAYGASIGRFGVPSVAEDVKNAGNLDSNLLAGYEASQLQKEAEEQKTKTTDEVRTTMDDATKSTFKRMAAALELISRKETNVKEVERMRTNLASKFQDKTKAVFEGAVSRNYMGASPLFDFDKHPENRERVRQGFESGAFSLSDLDSGTLERCGQAIATGIKPATFKRQYDNLPDSKKTVVERSLEKADTYDAREKLAKIQTIDDAFGNRADEKREYTRKLNIKVIQEIINEGNAKQRESLKRNLVTASGDLDEKAFAPDVYIRLMDKTVAASKAIRSALGVASQETEKASKTARDIEEEMFTV